MNYYLYVTVAEVVWVAAMVVLVLTGHPVWAVFAMFGAYFYKPDTDRISKS